MIRWLRIHLLLGLAVGALVSPALRAAVEFEYTEAHVEQGVLRNGERGILIHAEFKIRNAFGIKCAAVTDFYDTQGRPIPAFNAAYRNGGGCLSVVGEFTPDRASAEYRDFRLFVPYGVFLRELYWKTLSFRFEVYQYLPFALVGSGRPVGFIITPGDTQESRPAPSVDPQPSGGVSIDFNSSRAVNNIIENGLPGVRFHLNFDVTNAQNQILTVMVYVQDSNGNNLRASDSHYRSAGGTVFVAQRITPRFQKSFYKDHTLFLPYEAFATRSPEPMELSYYISVTDSQGNRIGKTSNRFSFVLAGR